METALLISPPVKSAVLRPAHEDDVEAVVTLLSHLGYQWSTRQLRDSYGMLLEDPTMTLIVAVHADDTVVGLITLRLAPVLRLNGYQVTVEELVVHQDYRGNGIGTQLMRFARQFTMKTRAVRMEVLISRTRESFKRLFYEKHGLHLATSAVYRLHF
jgi:GNAT superfamily N-acetyltransferase